MIEYSLFLFFTIWIASILYSSVGHGGASGYLAVMVIYGVNPELMKPAALVMNIFVTLLIIYRGCHQVSINWKILCPLILSSIPFAYLGGMVTLENEHYKYILCLTLIVAAWRMFAGELDRKSQPAPSLLSIILVGVILGLASGLTGIGGGIFLSPLLLIIGWTSMKESIPIVATFVLVNSASGLLGYLTIGEAIPGSIVFFVAAAFIGALIGSELAFRRLSGTGIRKMLGVVLFIAASKMILTV